jgi:regulator of protease activity HflC (stomatin/prohibitin superfamily)
MKKMLLLILLLAPVVLTGCAEIQSGEVGVKRTLGKISEKPMDPGWHLYNPLITQIEIWDIKTQELKEQAQVPSSEGLISVLDVSVLFNVPADRAPQVRKTIGYYYRNTILEPYVREAIRNVVSGYEVKALYSEKGRGEITVKILNHLKERLDPRGIIVQDALLRDVKLPPTFSMSIEAKLRAEQEALQKEFELQKAKKDAEIEVARAEGVAKANQVIAGSLTSNYLKYLWVQGLQKNESQVVYVPTEANLPILEAKRWELTGDKG